MFPEYPFKKPRRCRTKLPIALRPAELRKVARKMDAFLNKRPVDVLAKLESLSNGGNHFEHQGIFLGHATCVSIVRVSLRATALRTSNRCATRMLLLKSPDTFQYRKQSFNAPRIEGRGWQQSTRVAGRAEARVSTPQPRNITHGENSRYRNSDYRTSPSFALRYLIFRDL